MSHSLSICICTFKRPDQLKILIDTIYSSEFIRPSSLTEIVIVDNDPLGSAFPVCEKFESRHNPSLRYVHVEVPNISVARNTAVHVAKGNQLAFIDDDEIPENDWLLQLTNTMAATEADVVFGPVLPVTNKETPQWIIDGGYFNRARFLTGSTVSAGEARTGNVLLKRECIESVPGPFEIGFGQSGGEDTLFFSKLIKNKFSLIWCDEAIVKEDVPIDRANPSWLLRRSYRVGQTYIRTEFALLNKSIPAKEWIYYFSKSFVQLIASASLSFVTLPMSATRSFYWLRIFFSQLGKISALFGRRYHAYGN